MDLQNLKWLKNVTDQNPKVWAYSSFKQCHLFKLNWKSDEENAQQPQWGDLILLKQKGYITHLVKVLDYKPEKQRNDQWGIYRIVEVIWTLDDFSQIPESAKADKVLDYPEVQGYRQGNILFLETLPTFKNRWDKNGGLTAFQSHIRQFIESLGNNHD
jgi:soluble cytochrome b562